MYPAYQTFKALDGKDKEARLQLLRYWAVFATFSAAEFYTDMLVSWLPFYYEVKMLILLYLSIPFTKGSSTVYEMHMKPWLRAHQEEIDEAIAQLKSSLFSYVLSYRDRLALSAHETITAFCADKIPAALPLYTMLIALATETCKHLFSGPKTCSTPDSLSPSSSASDLSIAPQAAAKDTVGSNAEIVSQVVSSAPASTRAKPVSELENLPVSSLNASASAIQSKPHPALSAATSAKTTTNILQSTSRAHRRDVSAPVTTAEPKTRAAKKQQMQGTAMPLRGASASRPAPQLSKKETSVANLVEEDSILLASPSKRSSNPKIMPGSPSRRSAV